MTTNRAGRALNSLAMVISAIALNLCTSWGQER